MNLFGTIAVDLAYTWARLFIALGASVAAAVFFGVLAARNRTAERIILPLLDIGQTIPIVGFFPVVIVVIVALIPGLVGVNTAVIFLIFTSMFWNIAFGVYEAVKAIPHDLLDLAGIQMLDRWKRIWTLYVPAAMPRIAFQTVISWSIGLFYLVTSEIFSTGSKAFTVNNGLGVIIAQLTAIPNTGEYIILLVMFIVAVLLTRFVFLAPLQAYAEHFSFREEAGTRKSLALRFYSRIRAALPKRSLLSDRRLIFQPKTRHEVAPKPVKRPLIKPGTVPSLVVFAFLVIVALYVIASGANAYLHEVLVALGASFLRVWLVYLVCAAIALPLGIVVARSVKAYEPSLGVLQVLSAIPAPMLLPVIVALVYLLPFGGEITALTIIFIAEIWYLLFSVIAGIRTIPDQMVEMARTLRLTWYQKWKDVYVPAALPAFVTGSITAIGGAWNSLIVAEYFASQGTGAVVTQVGTGIGKVLDLAVLSTPPNFPELILALISMTVMVVLINRLGWQRIYNRVTERYRMAVGE